MSDPVARPPRCIHYVGFKDDRYWNAVRIFGGPRVIHRRWDWYAVHDVGPDDVVVFAEGDASQAMADRNANDIDERWLPAVAAGGAAGVANAAKAVIATSETASVPFTPRDGERSIRHPDAQKDSS